MAEGAVCHNPQAGLAWSLRRNCCRRASSIQSAEREGLQWMTMQELILNFHCPETEGESGKQTLKIWFCLIKGKESGTALISSCGEPLSAFVFQSRTLFDILKDQPCVHAIFPYKTFSPILANILFVISARVDACVVTLLPICSIYMVVPGIGKYELWKVCSPKCLSLHVKLPSLLIISLEADDI